MRTCAHLVCALTLLAAPAAAQSTTEDGIRALLRADYGVAASILRPLTDDASKPDRAAQFFMAVLYYSGQGVARDQDRACGLFLRVSSDANPFAEQAATIAAVLREQMGGAAFLCVANESWQGGPPLSFALGPKHKVVFADTSITVTHGEQEQRTVMLVPERTRFLPIRYTPLAVSSPRVTTRHFFQWFGWTSDKENPPSWTLTWALSEVVDDQLIAIAWEDNLAIVKGASPPSSYDLARVVQLRVNANGQAEFVIAGGSSPRTQVIPLKQAR